MKSYKRRRFSNKKTRRIKRRGGMHKSRPYPLYPHLTPEQRAKAHEKDRVNDPRRNKELTAAHTVLTQMVSRGVSHDVRTDLLKSGMGALAGSVSGLLLAKDPHLLRKHGDAALGAARPHTSIPALFEAADMFQQAEHLCSMVRKLPDEDCWATNAWGHVRKSEYVKDTCSKARSLYEGAIERKYLPAYAPLAWMMSREDPEGSMTLCDECIAKCKVIRNAASRKAKLDCTAIRAFADQESVALMMSQLHREQQHAPRWTHREDDDDVFDFESADPELEAFKTIMEESIENKSKYGHAMKWLWLSTLDDEYPNPDDIAKQKRVAENAGIDFDRCR